MRHRAYSALAVVLASTLTACERPEPVIEQTGVERVLSTLSSDSMMGREAFTPGAEMAVDFIAEEFSSIGLDYFSGLDGYRERFPVYSVSADSSRVTINGRVYPAERVAVRVAAPSLHWTAESNVQTVVAGPESDPMQAAMATFRNDANTLLLLHSSHEQVFRRFKQYFSGPTRTPSIEGTASSVLVLTDDLDVSTFDVDVAATVEEMSLTNVVGVIPGRRANEFVLFGAHHDHIGVIEPVDGDSIANGANDDASGVTAVIELARYFEARGKPTRTLVFVTFAAEEKGLIGSQHFSRLIPAEQVVALFNVEMIGKVGPYGPNTAWITGFEHSDFGEILQSATEDSVFSFNPDQPDTDMFFRSDNAPFARMGIPAHTITTTDINDGDYHQVSDEIETLDLTLMTNTIRAIARAAAPIVSGDATPTRVNVENLN